MNISFQHHQRLQWSYLTIMQYNYNIFKKIQIYPYRVFNIRIHWVAICSACCNCNCNCHVAASCQLTVRKLKFICIFDLPVVINMHTKCREGEREREKGGEQVRLREVKCEAILLPFDGNF